MPIIQLNIAEGRKDEQQAAAMTANPEEVVSTLDVLPEQVRILIIEVSPQNYAIAGETMAMRAARESSRPEPGS